jgi:hypothetical protein
MAFLSAALGISLAIGATLYAIAYVILAMLPGVEPSVVGHVAAGLGAIPIMGCTHVADMLEQRQAKKSAVPGRKTTIRTFEGFSISWPIMAVVGTLILIATMEFTVGYGALIAAGLAEVAGTPGLSKSNSIATVEEHFLYLQFGRSLAFWGIGAGANRGFPNI